MDKNAIKKYAVWARRELIERVSQKALQYGIAADGKADPHADSVNGHLLSDAEKKQRQALIRKVEEQGYEQTIEEVAYTWFNRFAALRFMEVNGYLPSHVRVFTNEEGEFKPQILSEAIRLELDGLDMDKVYELKNANKEEELFKYLLIVQCNALNKILPRMFQKIEDYTELLLPDYLLREGSVIQQMIALIPEQDWMDQVQIIGWLYQYYNAEPKDKVFADLKKNIKITKENIPAATQLFTPDWIVRYMVENSLGRLWLEGHPDSKGKLLPSQEEREAYAENRENPDGKWMYYLEEAEQEADVQKQLDEIRKEYASMKPEEIRCIDPCMGSGHILCYLFDVLVQIYEDYGYTAREAVASIIEHNLWGLDIDERAAQLAYFAVMMKARQYDRRIFSRNIQPHVYAIEESNGITTAPMHDMGLHLTSEEYGDAVKQALHLVEEMHDAKEYGSIIHVTPCDWNLLRRFAVPRDEDGQMHLNIHGEIEASARLQKLINAGEALSQKYHVIVTNPPYMGNGGMSKNLSRYISEYYTDGKADLFATFMLRCLEMLTKNGKTGMMTSYTWMFLSGYQAIRQNVVFNHDLDSLIQPEYHSFFEEAYVPICTFVINAKHTGGKSTFIRMEQFSGASQQEQKALEAIGNPICDYRYLFETELLHLVPGSPLIYWANPVMFKHYQTSPLIQEVAPPKPGLSTGENERFLRLWHEVSINRISFEGLDAKKWYPINKGGEYRKWYGNHHYLVNWENDGNEIRNFKDSSGKLKSRPQNLQYNFTPCISWSLITTGTFSVRYYPDCFIQNAAGICCHLDGEEMYYLLGFLNSKPAQAYASMISPTMNTNAGDIARVPLVIDESNLIHVNELVDSCIKLSINDWNSSESSWEFHRHPLIPAKDEGLTIFAGMKVSEKKWVDKLKDGSICFNRVGLFVEEGENGENNEQGDKYEGVFARLKKDDSRIKDLIDRFGDDLELVDDGNYVLLRRKSCKDVHIFCLYGFLKKDAEVIHCEEKENGDYSVQLKIKPSEKLFKSFLDSNLSENDVWHLCFSLGHFQSSVEQSLDELNLNHRFVKIQYDIPDSGEFLLNVDLDDNYYELEHKAQRFSYQNELRWILPDTHNDGRYVLSYTPLNNGRVGCGNGMSYCILDVTAHKQSNFISDCFSNWKGECEDRFQTLKSNEEELNRIFIDIYGLQDELTPEEEDRDVTVRRIFDTKEEIPENIRGSNYAITKRDVVVSLISYAVGCMFGRYSLDVDGLAYAGGEWDDSKYTTFLPDKDAIIPICDDDYFDDDITGRFVQWVETVYGDDTLEENLRFIADAIGGNGTPRQVIRKYFMNDFYADHCKTYQKRPIYWLFDSGKKNGFKCLIYIHRYQPDTIARIRTDYVHEQQSRYRTAIADLEQRMNGASTSERVKLGKQLSKLQDQADETREYEEKIHHLADQMIHIDLDDGVKHNYEIFKDVLAKIK